MDQDTIEFQIQDMLGIGMGLVIAGIGIALGIQVIGDVQDDMGNSGCASAIANPCCSAYNASSNMCYNGSNNTFTAMPPNAAFNASDQSLIAVTKLPEKFPTLVTVVVAAVILGVLVTYLWGRFSN